MTGAAADPADTQMAQSDSAITPNGDDGTRWARPARRARRRILVYSRVRRVLESQRACLFSTPGIDG